MLIVEVNNNNIEKALKALKVKVKNTKQNEELRSRKEFTKKSVKNREQKKTAIYKEKLNRTDV